MRYAVFRCTVLKEHGVQNEMETGEASKGVGKKTKKQKQSNYQIHEKYFSNLRNNHLRASRKFGSFLGNRHLKFFFR